MEMGYYSRIDPRVHVVISIVHQQVRLIGGLTSQIREMLKLKQTLSENVTGRHLVTEITAIAPL